MRSLLPREAFLRVSTRAGVAFLDGGTASGEASFLAWDPAATLHVDARSAEPLGEIAGFVAKEGARHRTVVGALAYELGHALEPGVRGRPRPEVPLAALHAYDLVHAFDPLSASWSPPLPDFPAAGPLPPPRIGRVGTDLTFDVYAERIRRALDWIAAGDVYQVNLAIPFLATFEGSAAQLYDCLSGRNPVPYGAFLDLGDMTILSNSPELFLERRGRRIVTRPIKGTRPRGATPAEDDRLARELAADGKELAEHRMIVDLERNDLGRIAEIGSVRVEELERVNRYATLHHLESRVAAELTAGVDLAGILRATFPGGSITGAPKIRAMQIIDALEPESRGFYTGAVVHIRPDGDFTANLAIRTATVAGSRIRYPAGSGIVADSIPEREYEECFLKAQAFLDAAGAFGERSIACLSST